MMKKTHVCNVEIRIEETSLRKARTVIKENVKMSKQSITAVLNGKDEFELLFTGLNKSWMYQLLLFTFSLRYFADHDLNS